MVLDIDEFSIISNDCASATGVGRVEHEGRKSLLKRSLPTTRYYGSKLRLIDELAGVFSSLHFETVLDAFGGTATVSLLFKVMGKKVCFNDLLMANCLSAKALLHPSVEGVAQRNVREFVEEVRPRKGFISKSFDGFFYTESENRWLDGAAALIHDLLDEQAKADIFYCLAQACLKKRPFNLFHRKNLYLRVNCSRKTSFGNWRTWDRSFPELMLKASGELEKAKRIRTGVASVLDPSDVMSLPAGFDLVYLDPPYVKEKKNDLTYLDRYHFLEGLARGVSWGKNIDPASKIKSLTPSPAFLGWNSAAAATRLLFEVVERNSGSIVALSYAEGGVPSIGEIVAFFNGLFSDVLVFKHGLSHALRCGEKEEVLVVGVP